MQIKVKMDRSPFYGQKGRYGRISVARTMMARLPRLFHTHSRVPWKIPQLQI